SSAPTPRAAEPLTGRTSSSPTVSGGMPRRESTGERAWAASSRAPEARSMYTAVSRPIRGGTMRASTPRPSPAPCTRASYTSTRRAMPYRATAAMIRGTSMVKNRLMSVPPDTSKHLGRGDPRRHRQGRGQPNGGQNVEGGLTPGGQPHRGHGGGDELDGGGVAHHQHAQGVGGPAGGAAAHEPGRLDAQGGGRVAQAQQVGRHVGRDAVHHRPVPG